MPRKISVILVSVAMLCGLGIHIEWADADDVQAIPVYTMGGWVNVDGVQLAPTTNLADQGYEITMDRADDGTEVASDTTDASNDAYRLDVAGAGVDPAKADLGDAVLISIRAGGLTKYPACVGQACGVPPDNTWIVGNPATGDPNDPWTTIYGEAHIYASIPPGIPTNLQASPNAGTEGAVDFVWNASGANDALGTVASYNVWYAESAMTTANFDAIGTQAQAGQLTFNPNALAAPGQAQSCTLTELSPGGLYYFAVQGGDAAAYGLPAIVGPIRASDLTDPYLASRNPGPGDTALYNTNISLQVLDDGAGVDPSITMTVNAQSVSPIIALIPGTDDYSVVYDPTQDFTLGQQVDVVVGAKDLVGRSINVPYSFNIANLKAAFTWSPDPQDELSPVQFTDQSTGAVSWSWAFGDGDTDSVQNPSHAYAEDGTYTVTLTASGNVLSDSVQHDVTVSDLDPTADFTWSPDPQNEAEVVNFTDASTPSAGDAINAWAWDFGDGNTSTDQNPFHTYADDGTYTVELTVTDDDGSTDTAQHDVTINDLGPSAAFGWDPSPQDEGSPVDFTDASTSAPDALASWAWDFGDGNTSTDQNPSHTYTDHGTYTVKLTVTDDDGSTDTYQEDTVTILDLGPTAAFTRAPQTPDELSAVNFTDASTSAPDAIASWAWNFGDGNTSTDQNPSHTYAEDDLYTVTLEVTDDDGTKDSVQHDVTVADLGPTAAFTWAPQTPNEGSGVQFTDTSTASAGDPIVGWAWNFGDGGTSNEQNPSHTYTDDGIYTVALTVTDDDGSTDTVQHDVTVADLGPTAAFTWAPDPQNEGSPVQFTDASTSAPDAIASWAWNFGDGVGTSSAQSPSYTYTDGGTYTVTLEVTDDDGTKDSVQHDVTILDVGPTAGFTWAPDPQNEGSPVQFTDTSTIALGTIVGWAWNFGDGNTSTDQNPSHTYTDDGTYTVALTVTDDDGLTDNVQHDVTVSDLGPTAAFTWAPEPQNEGSAVQFTDTSTSPADAIVGWAWNFGDGNTSTDQNPSNTYTDDGTYTVTLEVTDDDGSKDTVQHDVTVADLGPTAAFTWDPQTPDEGSPVDFTDASTSAPDAIASWAWNFGDGVGTSTDQNPSYTYAENGTYTVALTVTDDDGSTDTVQNDVTVADLGPTAAFTWAPETQDEGSPVQFTDTSTANTSIAAAGDPIVGWAWDFGDGGTSNEQNPAHTYTDDGTYPVKLTVTDDDGSANTVQNDVTIKNVPPVAETKPGEQDQEVPAARQVFISVVFGDPGKVDTHTAEVNWGDGIIETDESPNVNVTYGSITVTGTHVYEKAGAYAVAVKLIDDDGGTVVYNLTITAKGIELVSASYDVLKTNLTLRLKDPIDPEVTCFDGIGMEVDDSDQWDFALSDASGLTAKSGAAYTDPDTGQTIYPVVIDMNRAYVTALNLAVAALVNHHELDILLGPAAFKDAEGNENIEVVGADDVALQMVTNGLTLGNIGDVTGDGEVTAYDAALILQCTINGETVFPLYQTASEVSDWLTMNGYRCNIMEDTADADDSGYISAFDASMVLQYSAGLIRDFSSMLQAPVVSAIHRNGRLKVNDYDDRKLDLSIDLDDVSDVYSADIVMTYNPQTLMVADVSGTSSISGWLFEQGTTGPGKLRISLAGVSQPTADGSLVTVSFDTVSADAVKQLDITEFELNGGRLKATIENLPKAFSLLQNYPNPFNPETWIPYQLSKPADVTITIYNVNGQMVRRLELGNKMPGHYIGRAKSAYWDGRNDSGEAVSSGIYFYQLQAGRDASVRKMIVVK